MRVNLKGIHKVRKRLADGTVRVYHYAWRGGPRLEGEPGTAAFVAAFNKAIAEAKSPIAGDLKSLIAAYVKSTDFTKLAERTKRDYLRLLAVIEEKYGRMPLSLLGTKAARAQLLAWRDTLAAKSERQADYAWTVLARVLSWAKNRGLIETNPCVKGGRIYEADRTDRIWTDEHEAAFMASAPVHLRMALQLALWTGQRQGDLLSLPWSAYDGETIRLRQSKTATRVSVPVGKPLKEMLDAAPRRAKTILTNMDGEAWTADGFRSSWRKACAAAGVTGVTFHDLRGTAVTRLALVECTVPEIATLTGHSLKDVQNILDTHYLARDPRLARSAVTKLEGRKPSR
jgi:integrase